ncbi:MAG: hypothetical protein FJZ01_20015 [Candidatus Sericytochromatia bacterium]|nr:hypothetical protein [Candidatus Tanganyikabacteria bacterium]
MTSHRAFALLSGLCVLLLLLVGGCLGQIGAPRTAGAAIAPGANAGQAGPDGESVAVRVGAEGRLEITVWWPENRPPAAARIQLLPASVTRIDFTVRSAGTTLATASVTREGSEATASVSLSLATRSNLSILAEAATTGGTAVARGLTEGVSVAGGKTTAVPLLLSPLYVPAVTGLSTDSGSVGSEVTISGTNLSQAWAATPAVILTGSGASVSATVTAASGSAIAFNVPAGAVTGAVEVKVDGVTAAAGTFNVATARVLATVATWAGKGPPAEGGEVYDQAGQNATLYKPAALTIDDAGNLYTVPDGRGRVVKITPGAYVTQYNTGGPANFGDWDAINSMAFAKAGPQAGSLFVTDWSHLVVRKIASDGAVTVFAGTEDSSGDALGLPGTGKFTGPGAIAIDNTGNKMFVSDWFADNIRIVDMSSGEIVGSVPGRTHQGALAFDGANNLFMAKIDSIFRWPAATWQAANPAAPTLYAGYGDGTTGHQDGPVATAKFRNPCGMAFDAFGQLWIADAENHVIRKISDMSETGGTVSTPLGGYVDDGGGNQASIGFVNVSPPSALSAAQFNVPVGIAVDSAGRVYVADRENHAVRRAE